MSKRDAVRGLLLGMVFALALGACRRPVAVSPVDSFARRYLALCVALGERDPDALDFYVGPEEAVASLRRDPPALATIASQAAALRDEIASATAPAERDQRERQRLHFLMRQLDAVQLRAQMLAGKTLPMDQEGQTLFGVTLGPDEDAAKRAAARHELAALLGGADGLAHRYSLYERRLVVPQDKVPEVFAAALEHCRAVTLQHVVLPPGERVEVDYVSHKPWSGYSVYRGHGHSVVQINMDFPLTVDGLLDLACHEGYPGHHVFNTLREQALVEHAQEQEWAAQPTFSPQSFVSEAAASYAAALAFPADERLRVERDVLFPLAGLDGRCAERSLRVARLVDRLQTAVPGIARAYLDGRLEYVRAGDALEREALMEQPDALLLYLNEYRSYMLTYTLGRRMVARGVLAGAPGEDEPWRRYVSLMTEPVDSLTAFAGR